MPVPREKMVYKYRLRAINPNQEIVMPNDAKILHIGSQNGHLYVWAEHYVIRVSSKQVVAEYTPETRHFLVVPTGVPFEHDDLVFVGTAQCQIDHNYQEVYHVYVKKAGT